MRVHLLVALLAIATGAHALPIGPPLGCTSNAQCDPGPGMPCGVGLCVNGFCVLNPAPKGTVCRPKSGVCDVAEACDGASTACPADRFEPSTTVCRSAAGPCDVEERCTGTSPACPADALVSSGTICRPATGACDVAEACDGAHAACPADTVLPAGTLCRQAANDCDLSETCSGTSKDCPPDSSAPPGTPCENASACVSGGTCAGPVCLGGKPELTFAPDPAEFPAGVREIDVLVKHASSGAPIQLSGARIDPSGTFVITAAPTFPAPLQSGGQVHLTLRLAPGAAPGDQHATLLLQAASCADQPLQLHAVVDDPGGDAGTPDAGSGSPGGGSSSGSASSSDASKGGGCSTESAPQGLLLVLAWAAFAFASRRMPRA